MKIKFLFPVALFALVGCAASQDEPQEHTTSLPKQAIDRGESVDLESNMNQVRMFVADFKRDNDGRAPTLAELKAMKQFVPSLLINPVDKKPLVYNEQTGDISVDGVVRGKNSRASKINNSDPGNPAAIAAPALNAAPADNAETPQ